MQSSGRGEETHRASPEEAERLRQVGGALERATLLVYHRSAAHAVLLGAGVGVVVGREPTADVAIPDALLSRHHARFVLRGDHVVVEDLGSTNGTWMNGARIAQVEMRPGNEVILGGAVATLHLAAEGRAKLVGLDTHESFRAALDAEIVRARFFGRSAALVVVRAARGEQAHVRHWAPAVQSCLRPVDRVGLYSGDTIELLLPEVGADAAAGIARDVVASHPGLVCGVALFPESAMSAEELLDVGRAAVRGATDADPVRVEAAEQRTWVPGSFSSGDEPIGDGAGMTAIMKTVSRVARSLIPVLLHGETGTGKEVVARCIHERGPRRDKPLVCVNCAAIPAQLVESTLFGHDKGAFTGASAQHKGIFESADGGTVLLDEVGELPAAAQAALLRVLETKRLTRVGSSREIEVDVRIVAATHRDLDAMVASGGFRRDLFYRLNAMQLRIPPLRQRVEDIPALVRRFLRDANQANGTSIRDVDADALELLAAHAWPGNVRELRNAIERAVVIATGDVVTVEDLPEDVRPAPAVVHVQPAESARPAPDGAPTAARAAAEVDFRARMDRVESELIVEALRDSGWKQTAAAKRLGISLRTLLNKMKQHGIKRLGYAQSEHARRVGDDP